MMPPQSPQDQERDDQMRVIEERVAAYARRPRNWVREKKLGDQIRGRNEVTADLPPIEQLDGSYILIWHGEKPVLVRHDEEPDRWQIPAADFSAAEAGKGKPAAVFERWLKQTAQSLWGVQIGDWFQYSRFQLTATRTATDVVPGTVSYRLFLCVTASKLEDIAAESPWSRRTMTQRDLGQMIQSAYPEYYDILRPAVDAYLLQHERRD